MSDPPPTAQLDLVDVHAHLTDASFAGDIDDVLSRAAEAGLSSIVAVSMTPEDAHSVLALAAKHSMIHPCLGLHPCEVTAERVGAMCKLIEEHHEALVGLGECGLDFSPCILADGDAEEKKRLQREAFSRQITLGLKYDLALNVHSRSAGHYAIDQLLEEGEGRVRAVLHAFDGRAVHAERGARAGLVFSVPPSVVRSPQTQKLVRRLPLESLVLETDSPALGPDKGRRNEPANVLLSLRAIASLKGCCVEDVARQTTANVLRLFPKLRTAAGR